MLFAIKVRSSLLTAVCVAFLGGCAGMPDVKDGEIILDSKRHLLCYSTPYDCYDLSLIIANFERDRILRLHELDPWDWSQLDSVTEFIELLVRPDGGKQADKISKFIYRLPANERNIEAWSVLYDEYTMRSHSH